MLGHRHDRGDALVPAVGDVPASLDRPGDDRAARVGLRRSELGSRDVERRLVALAGGEPGRQDDLHERELVEELAVRLDPVVGGGDVALAVAGLGVPAFLDQVQADQPEFRLAGVDGPVGGHPDRPLDFPRRSGSGCRRRSSPTGRPWWAAGGSRSRCRPAGASSADRQGRYPTSRRMEPASCLSGRSRHRSRCRPRHHGTSSSLTQHANKEVVEMGESRTPRPEPITGTHYERGRWFVVNRPDEHRQPSGRSSRVSLDRACHRITQRSSDLQPR